MWSSWWYDFLLCHELIQTITYSAICLGRKETRVKCASFFRLCYCLTTMVYLAVSPHHFDTIVKKWHVLGKPRDRCFLLRWHIVKPKMETFYNTFLGVLKIAQMSESNKSIILGAGPLMRLLLHILLYSCSQLLYISLLNIQISVRKSLHGVPFT